MTLTPGTVAHQAPLSMGFSSKNTGVGCPALLQGIFLTLGSDPVSRPTSLLSLALAGRFFTTSTTWEAPQPEALTSKQRSSGVPPAPALWVS